MDAAELKRIKDVIERAEVVTREIDALTQAVDVGCDVCAVEFCFDEFRIRYQKKANENFHNACMSKLLADLNHEFRSAFLAIIVRRLNERKAELDALKV